ncbi:hypothetical protein N7468_004236 [Penicillium chermesinum]|uniref:Phosphoglycolate phosphatase n=1 Tax=Penicillium chermesinum TaxID=63820 RepID=A0A9W9TSJ9_9EURO|nr:uncharacterized protein N7468_004236 [Penicillium chermesinum]KAJ5239617.1 hypothetical protein N7468_004236 [Penicillium chermesinum]KAJ6166508.1 hypothetical protein N7470_001955 [Penicillium chermesinum]
MKPFDGAQKLFELLQSCNVLMSITLIVGDKTQGAARQPDPASYFNVLVPALKARAFDTAGDDWNVLVVGDTEADLGFALNIKGLNLSGVGMATVTWRVVKSFSSMSSSTI